MIPLLANQDLAPMLVLGVFHKKLSQLLGSLGIPCQKSGLKTPVKIIVLMFREHVFLNDSGLQDNSTQKAAHKVKNV